MKNIIWYFTPEEIEHLHQGEIVTKTNVINPYFRGGGEYLVGELTVKCKERYSPFNFKK